VVVVVVVVIVVVPGSRSSSSCCCSTSSCSHSRHRSLALDQVPASHLAPDEYWPFSEHFDSSRILQVGQISTGRIVQASYRCILSHLLSLKPCAGSGVVRIDPLRLLAGCCTRRLNQAQSVLSLSLGFFLLMYVLCC